MIRLILLILLFATPAYAWDLGWYSDGGGGSSSYCDTATFCEDFETNDTCTNLGFSNISNNVDCQDTTSPANGTYAMDILDDGTNSFLEYSFTATYEMYVKFNVRLYYNTGFHSSIACFVNGLQEQGKAKYFSRAIQAEALGDGTNDGSTAFSDGDWFTIKMRYYDADGAGTSNKAEFYLWVVAGKDGDTSGAATYSITDNTTENDSIDGILFYSEAASGAHNYFDDIKIGATDPDA